VITLSEKRANNTVPELPEVETTKRGISPHILGKTLRSVAIRQYQLRWPIPHELPNLITGRSLTAIKRRGKYLLFTFDNAITLLWHLGMSGSMRILKQPQSPGKHDHVDMLFENGRLLRFHDPRRFGALLFTEEPPEQHPLLARLGPEPLSTAFTPEYLFLRSRKRKIAVKAFIMDSHTVVGVGNIYANEALFRAGIHPLKGAARLSRDACQTLVISIQEILSNAIRQGGTTLRDFVGGDGKPGYFAQQLLVYGKAGQPCPLCTKPLTEKKLAQRATVYCTACQR